MKYKILFFLLISSANLFAQELLDPIPEYDPQIPRLRAQKIRMMRTLEVKDSIGWKPERCDYWDTSYFKYFPKYVRKTFIAYDPIDIGDVFNKHQCKGGVINGSATVGKDGQPSQYFWDTTEVPSDTIISTYDNDGYLLSKIFKTHSGHSHKDEFWYLDASKRVIGKSHYDYYGFEDSTSYEYNASGKLFRHLTINRAAVKDSGVVINGLHFIITKGGGNEYLYDTLGRIRYSVWFRNGKQDTSMVWDYFPHPNALEYIVHLYRDPIPHRNLSINTDSSLFDNNGKKIGFIRTIRDSNHTSIQTWIGNQRRGEKEFDKKGRLKSETIYTTDANENVTQSLSNFDPIIFRNEFTFDKNGLLTDVKPYRNNYQDKTVRLIRHIRYLYSKIELKK
jgi:hypothetical protein